MCLTAKAFNNQIDSGCAKLFWRQVLLHSCCFRSVCPWDFLQGLLAAFLVLVGFVFFLLHSVQPLQCVWTLYNRTLCNAKILQIKKCWQFHIFIKMSCIFATAVEIYFYPTIYVSFFVLSSIWLSPSGISVEPYNSETTGWNAVKFRWNV